MGLDLYNCWMLVGWWLGVHFGGGLMLIWVVAECFMECSGGCGCL